MSRDEIISNLELMRAEVEWEYPIDYAATIDEVIELIKNKEELPNAKVIIYPGVDIYDCCGYASGMNTISNYCPNCGRKVGKERIYRD